MTTPAVDWDHVFYDVPKGFWMRRIPIFEDFHLKVMPGETVGIIGPNGAGKTTCMKLGCGILRPEKGQVRIRGMAADTPASREGIGLLTEHQYIYPHLTLGEWVGFLGRLSGMDADTVFQRSGRLLEEMQLTHKKNELMKRLSKGQLQRAGIAQAFLNQPDILFLDEPMSGLDPFWRNRMLTLLTKYCKSGGTLIFSSHILADILELSHRIVLIRKGKIKWDGRPAELCNFQDQHKVVVGSDPAPILEKLPDISVDPLPDGSWSMVVGREDCRHVWTLAAEDRLKVNSVTPVSLDLERLGQ